MCDYLIVVNPRWVGFTPCWNHITSIPMYALNHFRHSVCILVFSQIISDLFTIYASVIKCWKNCKTSMVELCCRKVTLFFTFFDFLLSHGGWRLGGGPVQTTRIAYIQRGPAARPATKLSSASLKVTALKFQICNCVIIERCRFCHVAQWGWLQRAVPQCFVPLSVCPSGGDLVPKSGVTSHGQIVL